jgi:hypothetical protein
MIYVLKNEPSPSAFCDLLDFGVDKCAYALMMIQPLNRMSPKGESILKMLEPYLVDRKVTNKRPGTKRLGENALAHKYKYEAPLSGLIQKINDHLYGWLQPNFPEDLCLLRENEEPWFVSITHEKDSFFFLPDTEKNDLIQNIPELGRILKKDDGKHGV